MGDLARFTDKKIHLLKESMGDHGVSYCGLSERGTIWGAPDDAPTCHSCLRFFARRVEELGVAVDRLRERPV